jgi:hypothetical protein
MAVLICASVSTREMMFWLIAMSFAFHEKKPGECRAVLAPPRSVLAVIRDVADRLSAVERVGVWQMGGVCAAVLL